MNTRRRGSASEFEVVWKGPVATIRLSKAAVSAYRQVIDGTDEISVKRKVQLRRYFEEFCQNNPHRLGEEKFKKEGSFPDGRGGKVAVLAFKSWQWRLYGAELLVSGQRCFVGMRVDAAKKQDRADQSKLKGTAKDIAELIEYDR